MATEEWSARQLRARFPCRERSGPDHVGRPSARDRLRTQGATPPGSGHTRANTNAGVGPAFTRDVLIATRSYPEFRITAFIPTFRLSRLGRLTALFSLLLCGSGWLAGRDNREGVEEREERVGGLVSAGWGADRGGPVDRFLFEVLVGVLVDVGGLDALVAEPERDRRDVDVFGLEDGCTHPN